MLSFILKTNAYYFFRGDVLTITNITKESRGMYYCNAENGVGDGAERQVPVEVEFAPIISIPKRHYLQALKYNIDLKCHIEAYPPPEMYWAFNGVILSNDKHYR